MSAASGQAAEAGEAEGGKGAGKRMAAQLEDDGDFEEEVLEDSTTSKQPRPPTTAATGKAARSSSTSPGKGRRRSSGGGGSRGSSGAFALPSRSRKKQRTSSGDDAAAAEEEAGSADPAELFEEDEDFRDDYFLRKSETSEQMRLLLDSFNPEQRERHEVFRRAKLKLADVKKLMQAVTGGPAPTKKVQIVMAGIAKVFVGEMIEEAREVMEQRKETGGVRPTHLREAHRRLQSKGKVPSAHYHHGRLFK